MTKTLANTATMPFWLLSLTLTGKMQVCAVRSTMLCGSGWFSPYTADRPEIQQS
jgi:hypothetical protein